MHYLFSLVLKSKDLSKAGDLFTLPDSSIMNDISEILERIKEIASSSAYVDNENDQSVVEICIARLTATLRDSECIEEHIDALVDLLKTSLNHDLKPLAQETDPPHAKIASDVLACIFLNYSKRNVMKQALPVAVKFLHKGNKELSRNVSSYLPLAAIEHPELLASHIQPIIDSVIGGNYGLARLLPQIYSLNPERINEHVMALANLLSQCDDTEKCSLLALFKLVAARNGSNMSLVLQPSLPQLLYCLNNPATVGPTLEVLLEMSNDAKLLENHLDKIQESVMPPTTVNSSRMGANNEVNSSSNNKTNGGNGITSMSQNAVTAAQIFKHVIQSLCISTNKKEKCRQILLTRMIKLLDYTGKDQSAQLQILREILSLAHHSPWLVTSDVMYAISKSIHLTSNNISGVGHAALNKLWDLCDGSTPNQSSSAEILATPPPPQLLGTTFPVISSSKLTATSPSSRLPTSAANKIKSLNYSIFDGSTDRLGNHQNGTTTALSMTRLANFNMTLPTGNNHVPINNNNSNKPVVTSQQMPNHGSNSYGSSGILGSSTGMGVPSFSTYIPHTPSSSGVIGSHTIGLPTTISINSSRSPISHHRNNLSATAAAVDYRKRGGGINIMVPPVTVYPNRSVSTISGFRDEFPHNNTNGGVLPHHHHQLNPLLTSQSSMTPSVTGSTNNNAISNSSMTPVVIPPLPHELVWSTTGAIRSPTSKAGSQQYNLSKGTSGTFSSSAASILSGHGISSSAAANNFVSRLSTNQLTGSGFNNNNISYSIYLSNNNYNITSNSGFLTGKTNPNPTTGGGNGCYSSGSHHHHNQSQNSQNQYGGTNFKTTTGHSHTKLLHPLSPNGEINQSVITGSTVMSQPDLRLSAISTNGGSTNPNNHNNSLNANNASLQVASNNTVISGINRMSFVQLSSPEHPEKEFSNRGISSSPTITDGGHSENSHYPKHISVFEPFPMRDVVQHFCEKHLEKIKLYMEKITVRIPLPVKCTIEERKSRKNAKLHFACQFQTEHCIYSGTRLFSMKTRHPRIWIHLMFLALQARSQNQALSTRESSVSSLKNCWEILKCESKTFLTIVTSAFPSGADQDCLLLELRNAGYFDLFEFNALKGQWGCFFCNHPGRALQFLTGETPILEGCLKEKKVKWKLFKRWRTRYFTLSGGQLMARGSNNDSTSTLNLHQILSVRVTRTQRQIPKVFEIFTQDKKVVLKPKDGKNANEWVQCLSVLVAKNEAGGGGLDALQNSGGFNSCYPSQAHLSKASSVTGFRTEV